MLWSERDSSASARPGLPDGYDARALLYRAAGDADAGTEVDDVRADVAAVEWPRDDVIDGVLASVAEATSGRYGGAAQLSVEEIVLLRVGLFGARSRYLGPIGAFSSWSGLESAGLRASMRMTTLEFGGHLGVSDRLISYWEALGIRCQPRSLNQTRLDQALASAEPDVRLRFARQLEDRYVILAHSVKAAR